MTFGERNSALDDLSYKDLYPEDPNVPRRIYCDSCSGHLRLRFSSFDKQVSGIRIVLHGLAELYCESCDLAFLPDRSRIALIDAWERAEKQKKDSIRITRKATQEDFGYTDIKFLYDSDDYHYIPGLRRENSPGFLTPVFFNRRVLVKFDQLDDYKLGFASRTYGSIFTGDNSISFGVNSNGKVVMWLGDIATLPESEQHYLRSENVPSDHALGSEFYDGQIECKFTERSPEDSLVHSRSEFLTAAENIFGLPLSHLDEETLRDIEELLPPIHFAKKEQRRFADLLNRICVESINSKSLTKLLKDRGIETDGKGTLKKLQELILTDFPDQDAGALMCPFFVTYDLRIISSHLTGNDSVEETLDSARERLGLPSDAEFDTLYHELVKQLSAAYDSLIHAISPPCT